MVPKFATKPEAIEAAIAMAVEVPAASRPHNVAALSPDGKADRCIAKVGTRPLCSAPSLRRDQR